ncbi:SDR family NAD(P)-dependent oxidoreductase, partial [Micromonospora sp. NPDC048898]|uniref:type I polyketide synthase n=1 Tax=Micromonospora sp. NPDC048898 TaxID=3364260 RepID=UPI003715682D
IPNHIAAINGPNSTIISGDTTTITNLVTQYQNQGINAKLIDVDYASHSPHINTIRDQILTDLAEVDPQPASIAFYSTVTAQPIDTTTLTADYWYTNLREQVLFHPTVEHLINDGYRTFLECSPHPTLTTAIDNPALHIASLRRNDDTPHRLTTQRAILHTHHHPNTNHLTPTPTRPVNLPTYPFQHQRYWLDPTKTIQDATGLGQETSRHPLLSATIRMAGTGNVLHTGTISLHTHPWLADHAVGDTVLLPGTALLDMALHAAAHTTTPAIDDLTLQAPAEIPPGVTVQLQATTTESTVTIHSRNGDDEPWVLHASGTLTAAAPVPQAQPVWPPAEAIPVDITTLYDDLAAAGYHYGPAFTAVTAAWQHTDHTTYTTIALPEGLTTNGHTIHPALLDATLHPLATHTGDTIHLPFAWTGVTLHATNATELHATLTPTDNGITITAYDPTGQPVITINQLATRPVDPATLSVARTRVSRSAIAWREAGPAVPADPARTDVWPAPDGDLHQVTEAALRQLQTWLAEHADDDRRLVVHTRPGILAHRAVTGLARTAASENPERVVLVEAPDPAATVLVDGEPELAVRDGQVLVPRLTRLTDEPDGSRPLDPEGTVLITGGTGGLGRLLARHLAERHGVTRLVLASRTGPAHPDADDLRSLARHVELVACDTGDPEQIAALLADVDPAHPITAVIHAAGVLGDATIGSLTPERLHAVLAAKADAARHLHEQTRGLDLSAFVLFSSAAGVFGNPGQGNYAAANTYLDGLAEHRRSLGLPAVSMAWGQWAQETGLTARLGPSERRGGAMPTDLGLALFDAALAGGPAVQLLQPITGGMLRRADLPALLRELAPPALRTAADAGAGREGLTARLQALDPEQQHRHLLELVRGNVAAVLGHADARAVHEHRPFSEIGFDSLTAVELRNRLNAATGLRLPATMVFDHPTPGELTERIAGDLLGAPLTPAERLLTELDGLERTMSALEAADGDRTRITTRLQTLLAAWTTGGPEQPAAATGEEIRTASTAEIFAFIDEKLGRAAARE